MPRSQPAGLQLQTPVNDRLPSSSIYAWYCLSRQSLFSWPCASSNGGGQCPLGTCSIELCMQAAWSCLYVAPVIKSVAGRVSNVALCCEHLSCRTLLLPQQFHHSCCAACCSLRELGVRPTAAACVQHGRIRACQRVMCIRCLFHARSQRLAYGMRMQGKGSSARNVIYIECKSVQFQLWADLTIL